MTITTDSHTLAESLRILSRDCGFTGETALLEAAERLEYLSASNERYRKLIKNCNEIINDKVVGNQAAWIEWQHGKGAEAAMRWIHNGLEGPGHIPNKTEPYATEPEAYYNANRSNPFPACEICGRPSSQLWMGHGACCTEHMDEIREKTQEDATA